MTQQNTSTAVMQRRVEPLDSLDDFPTPPWATRALCEYIMSLLCDPASSTVWEPTCNRGHMSEPLKEYFGEVISTDIADYGYRHHNHTCDFLNSSGRGDTDWAIFNPPFKLALEFIQHGLNVSNAGVAVFVRGAFLEGIKRHETLFRDNPPTIIAPFAERVPLVKGHYDPKIGSATQYIWLIWRHGDEPRAPVWIPACRKELEREYDYPRDLFGNIIKW